MSQSVIILGPQIVCTACGVTFAMADTVCESYRDNNTTFYCTNGHPLSYQAANKKRVSSLEKENKALQAQIEVLTKENTLRSGTTLNSSLGALLSLSCSSST